VITTFKSNLGKMLKFWRAESLSPNFKSRPRRLRSRLHHWSKQTQKLFRALLPVLYFNCDSRAFSNAFKTCNKRWSGIHNASMHKVRTIHKIRFLSVLDCFDRDKEKITFSTIKHQSWSANISKSISPIRSRSARCTDGKPFILWAVTILPHGETHWWSYFAFIQTRLVEGKRVPEGILFYKTKYTLPFLSFPKFIKSAKSDHN